MDFHPPLPFTGNTKAPLSLSLLAPPSPLTAHSKNTSESNEGMTQTYGVQVLLKLIFNSLAGFFNQNCNCLMIFSFVLYPYDIYLTKNQSHLTHP